MRKNLCAGRAAAEKQQKKRLKGEGKSMRDKIHSIMDFEFRMDKIQNMHFHQTPEIVYVLDGAVEGELLLAQFYISFLK